jgi:hypothetical protein
MTVYFVHDEQGAVDQANKVFDSDGYDNLLREHEYMFVAASNMDDPPACWDVFVDRGRWAFRPRMPIIVRRRIFRAGGSDAAVLKNIPDGARITVTVTGNIALYRDEPVIGREIEISSPVPTAFHVTIERFPYRTFEIDLVAEGG